MTQHYDHSYAYGQHWTPATEDEDPQPLGPCGDPRGCPPVDQPAQSESDDD